MHVETDRPRRRNQLRRIVDANDFCPALDDLVRQGSVAAADVEDPFTRFRVEQVERSFPEVGNEAADPSIVRRVPAAGRGDRRGQSVFTQSR